MPRPHAPPRGRRNPPLPGRGRSPRPPLAPGGEARWRADHWFRRPRASRARPSPFHRDLAQGLPPALVVEIPVDRPREALLERHARPPAEFGANARGIDRVSLVVPGPVLDEADEPVVRRPPRPPRVEKRADHPHEVDVSRLVLAADIVAAPDTPFLQNPQQRVRMVLDEQPVAHVLARPVDRDRPALEGR